MTEWLNKCHFGDVPEWSITDLAYCAGVIDSDGTIGVKRSTYSMRVIGDAGKPTFSERVCVKQVEPHAVELLRNLFGGSYYKAKPSAAKGRALFVWQVTDRKAAICLAAIHPFLRIKQGQAENALALRLVKRLAAVERVAIGRGHAGAAPRSAENSAAMEQIYLQAKKLNIVGVQPGLIFTEASNA